MGYLKDSYNMSIKPLLDFASPVITPIGNFLTSGSNYNPNESAGSNFVNSFTTPSNLFDDTFMSDNMDLTYGGSDVPEMPSDTAIGPIVIKKGPTPSLLDDNVFMSDNMDLTYNSTGIDTADDRFRREAAANLLRDTGNNSNANRNPNPGGGNGGGGNSSSVNATPVSNVLNTRTFPFTSRTPSGSVYTPDLSAYNDSSLFNYEGPGGVPEYTYGQGLRTDGADYSIFGSPADAANPYFAGQFATPAGPADAAINMPAVELPSGVQPISADVSMPGFTGSGNQILNNTIGGLVPRPPNSAGDLTYQQTIDEMGIFGPNNPPPSTLFPSPGQATTTSSLADRIRTQMGDDNYQAMVDRANAMDNQLQNQINTNREVAAIAGSPAMDDTADIERGMLTSQRGTAMDDTADVDAGISLMPTDMQRYLDDFEARGITDRTQQIMEYATQNNNMIDGITIFDEGDPRQIFQDAILNPQPERENNPIYGGLDGIPLDDSFMMSDGPLARNKGKPFKPEGVEGEDYYQDVTGNFFDINDDLGTQPLNPPSGMDAGFLNRETGTGDALPQAVLPRIEPFQPPRPDNDMTFGQAGRTAYDGRSSYEREGTEELTSGDMGALNDAMTAIDAKYAGSKTDASAEAELKEILNATLNAFGGSGSTNARGARGETVPADIPAFLNQDISRMADKYVPSPAESDYPPAYQSYAREDEGTSTGESLFQNVAEDIPLSVFNPIDRIVMQAEAQAAQVAAAQAQAAANSQAAERAAAAAEARRNPPPPPPRVTPANVASIFSPPAGPPNMAQIRPMVARTQNNMTVPVMRDSAMDRRYGGPMRFGR